MLVDVVAHVACQDELLELITPARFDRVPLGSHFGDVTVDALPSYAPGEIASASFRSANPRNNQRLGGTFLAVQTLTSAGQWTNVAVDGDWETKFHWENASTSRLPCCVVHTLTY